jgi:hypothetical protein
MSDDLHTPLVKQSSSKSLHNLKIIQQIAYVKAHKEDHMRLSRSLFFKWRLFHLFYSAFAAIAILPAAIDYESRYSRDRTASECAIDNSDETYRWVIVLFSLAALCCLGAYRIYKLQWRTILQSVYEELPPLQNEHLFDLIKMKRKAAEQFILSRMTVFEIILLFVNPYPYLHATVVVPQQIDFNEVNVCYYISEFTYVLMYFRILFFCRSLLNFGNYKSEIAMRTCQQFRIPTKAAFALKCTVARYPLQTLAYFVTSSVVIFGLVQRVFERPMMHYPGQYEGQDFDYLGNSMWNIFITMTTVGYGDFSPITLFGRVVTAVSAFWGGIILSMTFVTLQSVFILTSNESKAYSLLNQAEAAANVIGAAFDYELQKRKYKVEDLNRFKEMRRLGKIFSKVKAQYHIDDDNQKLKETPQDVKLASLEKKMAEISAKLDKLITVS